MKKNRIAKALVLAMVASTLLTGCGKKKSKDDTTTDVATQSDASIKSVDISEMHSTNDMAVVTKEGCVINELSGEWIDEGLKNQRPLAVMFDNVPAALPHSGIGSADVVFEMIVEGGITRLMGVFKDYENVPKIGPVRSARQYYVQTADMLNCIYAHVGQSWLGEEWLIRTGINDLDGINGAVSGISYYRDTTRNAPHNCYTNGAIALEGIEYNGYSTEYTVNNDKMFLFNYEDKALESGKSANVVTCAFNGGYAPKFTYNSDDKNYYRYEYGQPHMDDQTGEQLHFKNIIVIFASYSVADTNLDLQDIAFDNGGTGYFASNGEYIDITWRKDNGILKFYTADGKQLKMNPGKTFVTVFKDTLMSNVTFE